MGCKSEFPAAALVMVCVTIAAGANPDQQSPTAPAVPVTSSWTGQTPVVIETYPFRSTTRNNQEVALVSGWTWSDATSQHEPRAGTLAHGIEPLPPVSEVSTKVALEPAMTSAVSDWSLLPPPPSPPTLSMGWGGNPPAANVGGSSQPLEYLPGTAPPLEPSTPAITGSYPVGPLPMSLGLPGDGGYLPPGPPPSTRLPISEWLLASPPPPGCATMFPYRFAGRFGWWGVSRSGDLTQVGEYQSVDPSPFIDVDGLWTDGMHTLDYYGTLLGADEAQLGLRYLEPSFSSLFFFQDYPHRLVNDPLTGFTSFDQQPPNPLPPAPNNFRIMKEDLNVGDDYAIHVQELRTGFKGKLNSHADWRLNVWSLRKYGQRQATAMAHCYTAPNATDSAGNPVTGISCHVLSQGQQIDWVTTEVEPGVEGRLGPATVEYKRTMRNFSQSDQLVTRPYDNFGFTGNLPYDVVPENYTAIDRLKFGIDLSPQSRVYAYLFNGNTENKNRDTNRRFHGYDLRITDRPFAGVSVTGYAKQYVQTGQFPPTLIDLETASSIRTPINYDRQWAGFKGRWRPFEGDCSWRSGLSFNGGYEYLELDRENALFAEQALTVDQSSTTVNSVRLRMDMRWNRQFDSFVLYRLAFINDPLFGVPVRNTATNSSLPTQEHLVEIGSTWSPVDTFLLSASFGINNSWHSSDIANFTEDAYPIVATAWYSPTPRWTISGGLAFFSNWIDQDITLGSKSNPVTLPANYGGQSDVFNIGTTFARTERLLMSLSYEYVRGSDLYSLPNPYADIGPLSTVAAELSRFSAGLDYAWRANIDCYARYQLFDYQDQAQNLTSGTASWILGGVSAVF